MRENGERGWVDLPVMFLKSGNVAVLTCGVPSAPWYVYLFGLQSCGKEPSHCCAARCSMQCRGHNSRRRVLDLVAHV